MRKSPRIILVLSLFLLLIPFTSFANGLNNGLPISNVESNVIDLHLHNIDPTIAEESLFPNYIPCDYWSDNRHRLQEGKSYSYEEYEYSHTHVIDGVWFECDVFRIYHIKEKYCACGYRPTTTTTGGTIHRVQ